jgi:hypothetical protein
MGTYVSCEVRTEYLNTIYMNSEGSQALSRVETGSNTSTVALRVEGGDEKGIQCLGV